MHPSHPVPVITPKSTFPFLRATFCFLLVCFASSHPSALAQADPDGAEDEKKAIEKLSSLSVPQLITMYLAYDPTGAYDQAAEKKASYPRKAILLRKAEAIPSVMKAFREVEQRRRGQILILLGDLYETGNTEIESLICELLKDRSRGPQMAALRAATEHAKLKKAIPILIEIIEDSSADDRFRRAAADSFEKLGQVGESAIPKLLRLLRDRQTNEQVRLGLINGLGTVGAKDGEVAEAIRKIMNDKNEHMKTRAGAALAMGRSFQGQSAVPELTELLRLKGNDQEQLRISALIAIELNGLRPTKAIIEPMVDILQDERMHIEYGAAISVLTRLGPEASDAFPAIRKGIDEGRLLGENPEFYAAALSKIVGVKLARTTLEESARRYTRNPQLQESILQRVRSTLDKLDN